MSLRLVIATVLVGLGLQSPALAQSEETAAGEPYFQDVQAFGFAYQSFNRDETLLGAGVATELRMWDSVGLNIELLGVAGLQDFNDDGYGVGFNLMPRWHFYEQGGVDLYLEGGAGIIYLSETFPTTRATHFNFTPQIGVGTRLDVGDGVSFTGGVRYLHLSNANIDGPDNNLGFDGVGGYLGLSFDF